MGWLKDGAFHPLSRKPFSIKSAQISGTPTNIPLALVITSATEIGEGARADAYDIAFTKADGTTEVDYERVAWTAGSGAVEVWFKAPDPESGDGYYLYYNDPDEGTDRQDAPGTWGNSFEMVHHMSGAAATLLLDSTSNDNDVDAEFGAPTYQQTGQIGYAVDFRGGAGDDDALKITTAASMDMQDPLTIEFWGYAHGIGIQAVKGGGGADNEWFFYTDGNGYVQLGAHNTSDAEQASGYCTTDIRNDWHYIVGQRVGATLSIWVDDEQENSAAIVGTLKTNQGPAYFGAQYAAGAIQNEYDGLLCEIRVSSAARSSNWLLTSYNNQKSPAPGGTFWSALGAEEHAPATDSKAAYLVGHSPATDNKAAYLVGHSPATDNKAGYARGLATASDSQAAYAVGHLPASDSVEGYARGLALASDSKAAYARGHASATDSQAAYAAGHAPASDSLEAYIRGLAAASDSKAGYARGLGSSTDSEAAYLFGHLIASDSKAAYCRSWNRASDSKAAYTRGWLAPSSTKSAFVRGPIAAPFQQPLVKVGPVFIPLYPVGAAYVGDDEPANPVSGLIWIDTS